MDTTSHHHRQCTQPTQPNKGDQGGAVFASAGGASAMGGNAPTATGVAPGNGAQLMHPRVFGRELKNIPECVRGGAHTAQHAYKPPAPMEIEEQTRELTPDRLLVATQPTAVYSRKIYDYLLQNQGMYLADAQYMTRTQRDITDRMRAILVDWLVDVHLKFKLLPETFFLTVNLIDRYLSKQSVPRTKLQLVGVAAMFIACKYEEIYAPEVKDFVHVCDRAYSKEEIFQMESSILLNLSFDLTHTSPLRFLERFLQLTPSGGNEDQDVHRMANTARYLLELAAMDIRMLHYAPSIVAASALVLAQRVVRCAAQAAAQQQQQGVMPVVNDMTHCCAWNQYLQAQTNLQSAQFEACVKDLCALLRATDGVQPTDRNALTAVKRKYSLARYSEVARTAYCSFILP